MTSSQQSDTSILLPESEAAAALSLTGDQLLALIPAQPWWAKLESPIEEEFAAWWVNRCCLHAALNCPVMARLQPQFEVTVDGRHYRLDFALVLNDWTLGLVSGTASRIINSDSWALRIGVELDGHDFHERTPEQVTRRNQRDRDLQCAGWKMFHFSGNELRQRPSACVDEVIRAAQDAMTHRRTEAVTSIGETLRRYVDAAVRAGENG